MAIANVFRGYNDFTLHVEHKREDKVGTLCSDYTDVMKMTVIGKGGFREVYLYTSPSGSQLAIKRERKVYC